MITVTYKIPAADVQNYLESLQFPTVNITRFERTPYGVKTYAVIYGFQVIIHLLVNDILEILEEKGYPGHDTLLAVNANEDSIEVVCV